MTSKTESGIASLRNIGPKSAEWLREAGLHTISDLEAVGAVAAYRRVRHLRPHDATRNLLFALQAGLMDIDFRHLPQEIKAELDRELGEP